MNFRSGEAWSYLMNHHFVFTLRPEEMAKRTVAIVDAWREVDGKELRYRARKVKLPVTIDIYTPDYSAPSVLLDQVKVLERYVKWSGFRSVGAWLRGAVEIHRPRFSPADTALYYVHLL